VQQHGQREQRIGAAGILSKNLPIDCRRPFSSAGTHVQVGLIQKSSLRW
jgi:hypothetical protein